MYHAKSVKEKTILFYKILWPILVTQMGLYAMNLFDTMMSGRAGTNDLAGVAIGASLWMPIFTGISGIILAVTPIVAQHLGSGQKDKISNAISQALYLAVILALFIITIGLYILEPILTFMDLEPQVHHIAKHYLFGLAFGIIPLFATNVLRNFFDAQGFTRITMLIILGALPVNILLNYVLIFGRFGFPQLGGIGAGYATTFTYWLILLISVIMTFKLKNIRGYGLFTNWPKPDIGAWRQQLKIGIPMGLSIFFEASIFAAVTLLIGIMFDTVTIAAHQSALNFSSFIFMIPLSISMALTILVGFEAGAKNAKDAKQYGQLGVVTALGFLTLLAVFFFFFREQIAMLYSDVPEVIAMTKSFIIFAIMYQISDGAQASLQGILRGYKDVSIPFIIALISYWIIGMPSGYALASYTALGPFGYWVGISLGLTSAAIGFFIRLLIVQRRKVGGVGPLITATSTAVKID